MNCAKDAIAAACIVVMAVAIMVSILCHTLLGEMKYQRERKALVEYRVRELEEFYKDGAIVVETRSAVYLRLYESSAGHCKGNLAMVKSVSHAEKRLPVPTYTGDLALPGDHWTVTLDKDGNYMLAERLRSSSEDLLAEKQK